MIATAQPTIAAPALATDEYSNDYSGWAPPALRLELVRLRNEVSFIVGDRGGPPREDRIAALNRAIARIQERLAQTSSVTQ